MELCLIILQKKDTRIKIVHLQGVGLVKALNKGVEFSKANWIVRMDSDDIATPDRLRIQKEMIDNNQGVKLFGGGVEIFRDEGEIQGGYLYYQEWINQLTEPEDIAREIFIESPIPHPTAVFEKETFLKLGGYKDNGWPEDYDLWLRFYEAGHKIAKTPEKILKWRDGEERLSRKSSSYNWEAFAKCRVHYLKRTVLKNSKSIILWGAGKDGKKYAKAFLKEGFQILNFIDVDKKKIGQRVYGIDVISYEDVRPVENAPLLACVGVKGVREFIRGELKKQGFIEGKDAFFLA